MSSGIVKQVSCGIRFHPLPHTQELGLLSFTFLSVPSQKIINRNYTSNSVKYSESSQLITLLGYGLFAQARLQPD